MTIQSIYGRTSQNPRDIASSDFPTGPSVEVQLKFLVNYAIFAPSLYNTQPWAFRILDHTIDVYADRSRVLAVVDPEDRYLTISCGASVRLFEIILGAYGFASETACFPDLNDTDLLARITVTKGSIRETPHDDTLRAILKRTTVRRGFLPKLLPVSFTNRLMDASSSRLGNYCVVDDPEKESIILDHVHEAERIQWEDIHFRREIQSWMHPMREHSRDGVPIPRGEPFSAYISGKYEEAPVGTTMLMVLSQQSDTPRAWLETGGQLMQLLFKASMEGIGAAIMQLPPASAVIKSMIGPLSGCEDEPVLLLRFGYPARRYMTPRRPPVDFMRHPGFQR